MQISMMDVGSIRSIDHAFVPHNDTKFRSYIRDKFERTMAHLEKTTGRVCTEFMDRTSRLFESVNNHEVLRKARAMGRVFRGNRRGNLIHHVRDLEDCRSAGLAMQRWILAQPDIRQDYLKQRIDGYSDSGNRNVHGNVWGIKHYDYRRVMHGIMTTDVDETGQEVIVIDHFFEELLEGDVQPQFDEQEVILDAWEVARRLRDAGFDPTDQRAGANQASDE